MEDKLKEYKERHNRWTETSITQLSIVNNLFITIACGLLAFCFSKKTFKNIQIDAGSPVDWTKTLYFSSILILALSILFGFAVLLSRLYDFRITRHILWVRIKYSNNKCDNTTKLPDHKSQDCNMCDRLSTLFKVIFIKIPFINKENIINCTKHLDMKKDFVVLLRMTDVLGNATWRWTKIQILLFCLSVILYTFHLLI